MKKFIKYESLLNGVLFLISFFIVVLPKLIPILCVVFLFIQFLGLKNKKIDFKINKVTGWFICFYLAYLIGSFFTNHIDEAFRYLENKFSFLIFPLLFSFNSKNGFNIKWPAIGIVLGVVVVSSLGLYNGYICFKATDVINCFFFTSFSYIHHPTYFSEYCLFAFALVLFGYTQKWKGIKLITLITFLGFTIIIEMLSGSLSSLLLLILFILVVFTYLIFSNFSKITFISILIVLPVLVYYSLIHIPIIDEQFKSSKSSFLEYYHNPTEYIKKKEHTDGGNITRLIMWTVTTQEILAHPLGVGTGNVDDHLRERLISFKKNDLAKLNYNPHNQFLQTTLEIGVIGLLILLLIIFSSINFAWKNKNWLLLLLICSLSFNSLFESMLQRQSGIIFYSFWICLLVSYSINNNINNKLNDLK